MQAIIHGIRYNTENAQLIGKANNLKKGANSVTDFSYWSAGLYKRRRSGGYFLAGYGGPMTRFGVREGQSYWSGGSRIIPMMEADAFRWAQQSLPVEVVERHFASDGRARAGLTPGIADRGGMTFPRT